MEAPEYFQANFYPQFNQEKRIMDTKQNDPFAVEEFLDFSNEEDNNNNAAIIGCGDATTTTFNDTINTGGTSTESSTVTVVDSCNSSFSAGCDNPHLLAGDHYEHHRNLADGNNFSNDLCVPYDDLAELEWLSNFVEESFSSEDLQKLQLISGMKARPDETSSETNEFLPEPNKTNTIFRPEMPVPGKARSKRSRAAPCNWTSRLLVVSPTTSSSDTEFPPIASLGKKTVKSALKKKDGSDLDDGSGSRSGDGRKCLHCATDKTPQWRTGPMGPKTLCNACGVRYKSGRLVPEYRPAASPTFVLTKHSNSHRKVLELRRQKEIQRSHQHQQHQQFIHHHQNMMFDVSKGDDYLIHQHVGPDFRQLI